MVSRPPPSWTAPRIAADTLDLLAPARRVIEGALSLAPGDTVVIVFDRERAALSTALHEAAKWRGTKTLTFELDAFGPPPLKELPKSIEAAFAGAQASIFVARSHADEIELRRQLVNAAARAGVRHAHMVGVTAKTMIAGLAVDPRRIEDVARALRRRMRPDSEIRLRSESGSDLSVRLDPRFRWLENSGIILPGRWLNLPGGELSTSVARVEGTFVCDASMTSMPGYESESLQTPLSLRIDGQRVTSVSCANRDALRAVEAFMRGGSNQDRVGLVSFGTNIGLSEVLGALIVDQTLPGLHLALGAPMPELTGLDWSSAGQLVLTSRKVDIDIDGQAVMRHGRYLLG